MRKYFFIAIILLIMPFLTVACQDRNNGESAIAKIGDIEYNSLSEALNNSEDGDTILIYNDVIESYESDELLNFTSKKIDNKTYVAYELKKPITIKGVINNGVKPKIYGSFLIELSDIKYKDNFITVENLEIIHDYISTENGSENEMFTAGIRVYEGSANIVDNYIHMGNNVSDEIIKSNNLPLYYGIMLSRPESSNLSNESFDYDISGNNFGNYHNKKGDSYSSSFIIIENTENIGEFSPSKINTSSYNYSLGIYNKNNNENDSIIFACHFDGKTNQYKSLITKYIDVVKFDNLVLPESRFIFDNDFGDDNIQSIDVYGVMVFTGNVKNTIFNLMNKDAKVEVVGEKLGETKINKFEE